MRIILTITLLTVLAACNFTATDKKIPSKSNRETIEKEIVGIWELLKMNYRPTNEVSLVDPKNREYLEIKSDGTCQDDDSNYKWFLSYTNDYVLDSTSKVIFTELSNLSPNGWEEYDRTIRPYQIKVTTENNIKYLYLTSLRTSATRVFIRKN